MNTGALVYAFDGDIQYTKIAAECAKRVKTHLGLPTTLVTDNANTIEPGVFEDVKLVRRPDSGGKRNWADGNVTTSWVNSRRCLALKHTPYDRTLLLDADYLVESDYLLNFINASGDFYAHNTRRYINEPTSYVETFGLGRTPMWWATVCIFSKTQFVQDVFDIWRMVEDNYQHYANLLRFSPHPFRNDYALSIALMLANGNIQPSQCAIPVPLLNVPDSCEIEQLDKWTLTYSVLDHNQLKPKKITVEQQDLHIMGKFNLQRILSK